MKRTLDNTIEYDAKTREAYLSKARGLAARYHRETGHSFESTPMAFVDWLSALKPSLKPASWRLYKASCVCFLRMFGPIEAVDRLLSMDNSGCVNRKDGDKKTSQQKQKSLPPEDLDALCFWLSERGGKWDLLAAAWLRVGVLTGLRPSEWRGATLALDTKQLRVKNAKNSQGRACGEWRILDLSGFDADELTLVAHVAEQLGAAADGYADAYNACRQRVAVASKTLWPGKDRHPTLYSGRHQFAANAKSSGLSCVEIAALMGHMDEDTATMHYGRKSSGRSPVRVVPSQENMDIINAHRKGNPSKSQTYKHKQTKGN